MAFTIKNGLTGYLNIRIDEKSKTKVELKRASLYQGMKELCNRKVMHLVHRI